jgi:hypothetical protein
VRRQVVLAHPELERDDGLLNRLQGAYAYCTQIGFTDGPAITQFLFYEAVAPGFYRDPAVGAWLTRPPATPELRFSDFIAVAKARMREL